MEDTFGSSSSSLMTITDLVLNSGKHQPGRWNVGVMCPEHDDMVSSDCGHGTSVKNTNTMSLLSNKKEETQ